MDNSLISYILCSSLTSLIVWPNYSNTGRNFETQRQYQPNNQYFPQARQQRVFVRGDSNTPFRSKPYSRGRGYKNRGNYIHSTTNYRRSKPFGNECRGNFPDQDSTQTFNASNEEAIDLNCDIIPENKTCDNSGEKNETVTVSKSLLRTDSDSETVCLDEFDHMVPRTSTPIETHKECHTSNKVRKGEYSENKIKKVTSPCEGSPNCENTEKIPSVDSNGSRTSNTTNERYPRKRRKCSNPEHSSYVLVEKNDDSQDPRLKHDKEPSKEHYSERVVSLRIIKWKKVTKKTEEDVADDSKQSKELDASGKVVKGTTPKDPHKFKDPRASSNLYRNQENENEQKQSAIKKNNTKLIPSSIEMKEQNQKSKTRPGSEITLKHADEMDQVNKNKPIIKDKNFLIRRDNRVIRRHYRGSVSKFYCYVPLSPINYDQSNCNDDDDPSCIDKSDDSINLLDCIDTKQSYLPPTNRKEEHIENTVCETDKTKEKVDKPSKQPDDKDREKILADSNKKLNVAENSRPPEECRTTNTPSLEELNANKNKQEDSIKRRFLQKYQIGNVSLNTLKNKNKQKKILTEESDEIDKNFTYSPKTDIKKKLYDACTDSYHDLNGLGRMQSRDIKSNAENHKQKQLTELFGEDLFDLENSSSERTGRDTEIPEQPPKQILKRRLSDSCEDKKIIPKKIRMRRKTLACTSCHIYDDDQNISELCKYRKRRKSPDHEIELSKSADLEEENTSSHEENLVEAPNVTNESETGVDQDKLDVTSESLSNHQNMERKSMKNVEDSNLTSEHKDEQNGVPKAQRPESSSKRQHLDKPSDRKKKRKCSEEESKSKKECSEKEKTLDLPHLSPNLESDSPKQKKSANVCNEKRHSKKDSDHIKTTETAKLNIEEELIRKYLEKRKTHGKKQKHKNEKPREKKIDQKSRNTDIEKQKVNTEEYLIKKYTGQDKSKIDTNEQNHSKKTHKQKAKKIENSKRSTERKSSYEEQKQKMAEDNKNSSDQVSTENINHEILSCSANVIHIEETQTRADSSSDDILKILNDSSITLIDKESNVMKETDIDSHKIGTVEINNNSEVCLEASLNKTNQIFFALPETLPEEELEVASNLTMRGENYQKASSELIPFEEHSQLNDFGNNRAEIVDPFIDLTSEENEYDNFCNVLITNVRTDVSHFVKSEESESNQMDVTCDDEKYERLSESKTAVISTLEDTAEEVYEIRNEDIPIPVLAEQTIVVNNLQRASFYIATVLIPEQLNQATAADFKERRTNQGQPETYKQAQVSSNITVSPNTLQTLNHEHLSRLTDAFYYEVFEILRAYSFLKKQYEGAFGSIQQTTQTSPIRYIQIDVEKEFVASIIQSKRNTYSFCLMTLVNKLPVDVVDDIFRMYAAKIFQRTQEVFYKIIAILYEFVENPYLPLNNIGNFPKFREVVQFCHEKLLKRNRAPIMTEQQRLITKHQIEQYLELTRENPSQATVCCPPKLFCGRNATKKTSQQSTSAQLEKNIKKNNLKAHAKKHAPQEAMLNSSHQPQRTPAAYSTMHAQCSTSGKSQPNIPTLLPNRILYGKQFENASPPLYREKQPNDQPQRNELSNPYQMRLVNVNNSNTMFHTRGSILGVNQSSCTLFGPPNVTIGNADAYNLSKTVERVIENSLPPTTKQPQVNVLWSSQTTNTVRAPTTTQSFSQAPSIPNRCMETIEQSRRNISIESIVSVNIAARSEVPELPNQCPSQENIQVRKVPDAPSNVTTQKESQPSEVSPDNTLLRKLLFSVGNNVSIYQVTQNSTPPVDQPLEVPQNASSVNKEPDTSTVNNQPIASTTTEEPSDDIVDLTNSDMETVRAKNCNTVILNSDTIDLRHPDLNIKDEEIRLSQNSDSDINQVTSTSNDDGQGMESANSNNLEEDVKSQIIKYLDVKERDEQQKPEDDIIDLTWLDDVPLKEETMDNDDVIRTDEGEERASQTPSGSNEAENTAMQSEHAPGTDFLSNRQCFCGKTAEYLCYCATVMYCSQTCQINHWGQHQKTCSSTAYLQE